MSLKISSPSRPASQALTITSTSLRRIALCSRLSCFFDAGVAGLVPELVGEDRQILVPPRLVLGVVGLRVDLLDEVADGEADDVGVRLVEAVGHLLRAQRLRHVGGDAWLLADDEGLCHCLLTLARKPSRAAVMPPRHSADNRATLPPRIQLSAVPDKEPDQRPHLETVAGAGEPVSASALLDYTSAGTSLVAAYRTHGHLAARLDPLGTLAPDDPALHPEYHGLTEEAMRAIPARALRVYVDGETLWDVLPHLREIYCGTVAYEIEHLSSHEQRRWLREAIESRRFWVPTQVEEKRRLLIRLLRVEGFESTCAARSSARRRSRSRVST